MTAVETQEITATNNEEDKDEAVRKMLENFNPKTDSLLKKYYEFSENAKLNN